MYKKGSCRHLDDWIEIVEKRKQPVCAETIQNVELVKKRLNDKNVIVDINKINECIELIEKYRPYKLTPIQRYIHACIAGLFYKDGTVVFREFFIQSGRGFGKNSLISDTTFYLTSNRHGIKDYDVDMVATSEEQAKTSYFDVYDTIDNNPELIPAYSRTLIEMHFKKTNSRIKYWTSNAKTKDGLRPGAIVFDEIHEYTNWDMINVFTSALGKVQNPRIFYITTDGYVREGIIDEFKRISKDVLSGKSKRRMFPLICRIEQLEEWHDPDMWIKANPNLPHLPILQTEMQEHYLTANDTLSAKIEFLTKRMNFPLLDPTITVASHEQLLAASDEIPDLTGWECIGALDYADVRDFIGVGLLFRKDNMRYWLHHTFIVEESLKINNFNQDLLRTAKEKGLYTVIPGVVADADTVVLWFMTMAKKYRIKKVVGDAYRMNLLQETFQKYGLPFEVVRSGPITHSMIAPTIDTLFGKQLIKWGDDPMMRWYTNNTKVVTDGKGNKTYHKIEPELRKTDGFFALVHALSKEDEIKAPVKYNSKLKSYSY